MKNIQLTDDFRRRTRHAVFTIFLFVLVYLLLVLLGVGFAVACVYAAIQLVAHFPRAITVMLGIGLAGLGVFILIFLFKFVFSAKKTDRSHLLKISREEEPELFRMIDTIVKGVATNPPKNVYLSSEVNAAVFYDSSFWSMFLPVQKNLQIGLGLINTVSKDELKGILAHEFGHFSQRTMKVGSYVYNVNQIIFNMLYENDSYNSLMQRWSRASGYFTVFVAIGVKIVGGIQWVLGKMYQVVNLGYLGLSREMEFHADAIAATIAGPAPLQNALWRMELSDYAFTSVLRFYEQKIDDNTRSPNIYPEQDFISRFHARADGIPFEEGLPIITAAHRARFNKSRLKLNNQWASHPTTEERVARMDTLNRGDGSYDHAPANATIKRLEQYQEYFTDEIFRNVAYTKAVEHYPLKAFEAEYDSNYQAYTFNPVFRSYYDNKDIEAFDTDAVAAQQQTDTNFFSEEWVDQVYMAVALKNDIEALQQITDQSIKVKTFDYDGIKYKRAAAPVVQQQLRSDLDVINGQIRENDRNIYRHLLFIAAQQGREQEVKEAYNALFAYDSSFDKRLETSRAIWDRLNFIYEATPHKMIQSNFEQLKPLEQAFKAQLKNMMTDPLYETACTAGMRDIMKQYIENSSAYHVIDHYDDAVLKLLIDSLNHYGFLVGRGYFILKQRLLKKQEELLFTGAL
ncbi:M48 family metalloprotease [Niabella beijingensis]|uniref:M48 family metalloprotease n=1 Tax=Niabella beijingensis TaxID=2872700 RepID=UPI001CBD90D3|nr:M48 family metallopeptidase [Niabella beijingensis]MBZ4190308.1 M48 family metalloprotease [Niabella beijingensis]